MAHRIRKALALAALGGVALAPLARATGYEDDDYRSFDVDNMSRSSGRTVAQLTDPEYHADLVATAFESHVENGLDQVREAPHGRVYAGLGHLLPGGSVGDPKAYHEVTTTEVNFVFRSGAKLEGHVFHPVAGPGPGPAVVITTGSIQGTQHMYWWAARTLAQHGYAVFTWDVQGQGESETTPHAPGQVLPFVDPGSDAGYTDDGVPFQQGFNFVEGTVDALRFFTSTPEDPYVPGGWSEEDLAAAKAAHDPGSEPIDWVNPAWQAFDGEHLGIAGHSLGAGAVSIVQQCSDRSARWQQVEVCGGRSFPIDAVVGWDRLAAGAGVVPVVPGMDQQADGYFLNTSPTMTAPDAAAQGARVEGGSFDAWRRAGLDTYTLTVRGGLHSEWTEVPYILTSTTYGVGMADYYTLAWMDRYVHPDPARSRSGQDMLVRGPVPSAEEFSAGAVPPWRANLMSARYRGGMSLTSLGTEPAARPGKGRGRPVPHAPQRFEATDLRAYAGLSPVGDWAGANADRPAPAPPNG